MSRLADRVRELDADMERDGMDSAAAHLIVGDGKVFKSLAAYIESAEAVRNHQARRAFEATFDARCKVYDAARAALTAALAREGER